LEKVIEHIPAPKIAVGATQLQITALDFSSFVGRIAIGRLFRGSLVPGQNIMLIKRDGRQVKQKIKELMVFEGLGKIKVDKVEAGEICAIVGLEEFEIGDTVADIDNPEAMPAISIDEPTMSMLFSINNSPFFGKEGKFVTSRHIKERLEKELEKNLAMKMEPTGSADSFMVYGRGVLHLSILIEEMRREGYELQVGQPQVLIKTIDGKKCEPVEALTIDVPEEYSGTAIDMLTRRKGEMLSMVPTGSRVKIEFNIPSRGIIGLRSNMLTATAGEAIMSHRFKAYEPWKGDIPERQNGSLISLEQGTSIAYSIDKLQDRGKFFIDPTTEIYEGQVIGEHSKEGDLCINVTKSKQLTNMRASGSDNKVRIIPAIKHSLEEALEYIQSDEFVEVTPISIRLRKILLKEGERKRGGK
jgi:GTP-binding protein